MSGDITKCNRGHLSQKRVGGIGERKGEVTQSPWTLTERIFDSSIQATPELHSLAEGEIRLIFSFPSTQAG